MNEITICGVLNFSKVYMIHSISKRIEDYLMVKLLEIKSGGYNQNRSVDWIIRVGDQNDFRNVVNMSARL